MIISTFPVSTTVGYELTVYTTSEGDGHVEMCAVVFDPPSGGAPRSFTLTVTTEDGTAGRSVYIRCIYSSMLAIHPKCRGL